LLDDESSQYPKRYNVWVGILNNQLIGPFFIKSNLITTKYEEMLRNEIIPAIRQIVDDTYAQTCAVSAGWHLILIETFITT